MAVGRPGRPPQGVPCSAPMPQSEHKVELIKGYNVAKLWSGQCTCGRIVGDGRYGEVKREAEEHERGEAPPWIIKPGELRRPWQPRDEPIYSGETGGSRA